MIKFKVHIYDKDQDKIIPHICIIDSLVLRANSVFVNVGQKGNKTNIQSFELPKNESLNIITLIKN